MLMSAALLCLSLNIYHEARGEPIIGQHAVAQVTMNRAGRDPKKVCEVVTKPKQFSWTNPGAGLVKRKNGKVMLTKRGEPKEQDAWKMAQHIARATLSGHVHDFTRGAMFYHDKKVSPSWKKDLRLIMVLGQHRFYTYA